MSKLSSILDSVFSLFSTGVNHTPMPKPCFGCGDDGSNICARIREAKAKFNKLNDVFLFVSDKITACYLFGILKIGGDDDPFEFDNNINDANDRLKTVGIAPGLIVTRNMLMFNKQVKQVFSELLIRKKEALIEVKKLEAERAAKHASVN